MRVGTSCIFVVHGRFALGAYTACCTQQALVMCKNNTRVYHGFAAYGGLAWQLPLAARAKQLHTAGLILRLGSNTRAILATPSPNTNHAVCLPCPSVMQRVSSLGGMENYVQYIPIFPRPDNAYCNNCLRYEKVNLALPGKRCAHAAADCTR